MSSSLPPEDMDIDQPAEDVPAEDAPRRSSRKRKVPEKFVPESRPRAAKAGKDNQEEQDGDEENEDDEDEDEDEDDEDSGDDVPESRNAKKRKTAITNNDKPTTAAKRGQERATKQATTTAAAPGERKARGRPKGSTNANKAAGKSDAGRPKTTTTKATTQGVVGDGEVKDDNGLFNALIQPDLALEQFVEGWVADYQTSSEEDEKIHVHELVVFFFRCCGVGCEIELNDAIDLDHTGSTMDDIHEAMKENDETPIYPLLSRNKTYKPLRKNIETFISCLISHLARSPYLYTTVDSPPPSSGPTVPLLTLLLNWLNPMSGSHYRAIRHTSTLIAMQLGTALCVEAKALEDQLAEAMRKRDAEGRKKKKDKVVVKNFEASIKELSKKKTVVNEYLKDIVLAFFVHRYRDRDPLIRADCLKEMGLFMKNYSEKFVNTEHLQYIDSGLTDLDPHARLEAIKALVPLYGPDTRITSMTTFTSRVVPRIIDMAVRDIDLRIRIQAINVLCHLDASGVLQDEEEEQRYHIACLIFDKEPRIRKAVGGLIKSMWEEQVEEMKTKDESEPVVAKKTKKGRGRPAADVEDEDDERDENDEQLLERDHRIGWKTLASLLMQLSNQLSASQRDEMIDLAGSAEDTHTTQSQVQRAREVLSSVSQLTSAMDTHASIAVEALWNEIPLVQDCETLLSFVAADQSVLEKEERPWALDDDEQTFLLKMLVTGVRKTTDHDKQKRKEDDETEAMEVQLTRNLIDTIPKLISKHQSDPIRVSVVLQLASLMSFPIYAEMRLTDAYERLWGDLIRQYLRHTDHVVLQQVLQLMRSLLATADLKAVNETKLQEFKENLVQNIQESLGDIDVATSSLKEEELHNIESAVLRLRMVFPQMDIRDIFDGDDESEQTGVWEIVLAVADRGKLGYKEEVKLVEHAMKIMVWYLSWTAVKVTEEDVSSDKVREKIESRRDETLRVLNEYAVGNHSNADEAVRREAVTDLLRFYVIFRPVESKEDTTLSPCQTALSVSMDDSLQFRCAGTIQAAIDKYIDHIGGKQPTREDDASSDLSTVEDGEEGDQPQKKPKSKPAPTPASIAYTAEFQTLIWSFISAMRAGVVESQHARVLLKEYGRLDQAFDASLHVVAEILQDEGMYNQDGEMVSKVIGQALQESFEYHLDIATDSDPTTTLGLAKLVSSAFFVHKSHFRLERKLPSENVVDFHEDGIAWCIRKYSALSRSEKNVKDKTTKDRLRKREYACLSYFKILTLLTPALGGRDALKVKSRLAEILKDQKEVAWPKVKGHDFVNAYEKRLMSIASSDSAVKAASKAQVERDHHVDALHNDDQQAEDDLIVPAFASAAGPVTPKRPQPVQRTRANAALEEEMVDDAADPVANDVEQEANVTIDETEGSPPVEHDAEVQEGNVDAEIDSTRQDRPVMEVHISPVAANADLPWSSPPDATSNNDAEEGRATRASSAVSFGDVQPAKRIRRR